MKDRRVVLDWESYWFFQEKMIQDVAAGQKLSDLRNEGKKFVLYFTAAWCGPCTKMAPEVKRIVDEVTDLKFFRVDIDSCPELASELDIRSVPSFLFFSEDSQKDPESVVGADPRKLEVKARSFAGTTSK